MSPARHEWQDLDRYLQVHESSLEPTETYFVTENDLRVPVLLTPAEVHFRGVIRCLGDIEIHTRIWLERNRRNQIRGISFRYHAQIGRPRVIPILRYDNADHYPDHPDAFHKHLFDATGKQVAIEHVGRDAFPTLRNVIDEVFEWWKQARDDPHYYS